MANVTVNFMVGTPMISDKLKALVHFIVEESQDPARLGATRLNKTLWHADVAAYKLRGESITGAKYIKKPNGPVPVAIGQVIKALSDEGKIVTREPAYQYDTRKFVSVSKPDTAQLSDFDMELIREILSDLCSQTATRVSEQTHDRIWEAAEMGEEIPLYATLAAGEGVLTPEVLRWADKVVAAAG